MHQSYNFRDRSDTWLKSIFAIEVLKMCVDRHWWFSHPPSFRSLANLDGCKITLVGSRWSGWYLYQSYNSRDRSDTRLKSIFAIKVLKMCVDRHWWFCHPPSFPFLTTLDGCKITLVGFRRSARYLHQSYNSRDQSDTRLNSIFAIEVLKMCLDRQWWFSHLPSFLSLADLDGRNVTLVGSRRSGRYLYQSSNSRDRCDAWLKSISVIELLKMILDRHWWFSHPPPFLFCRLWTICKLTLVGFRRSGRYLHQSYNSRDQSDIWQKTASVIELLKMSLERHWWFCHPPSFPFLATLDGL